MNAALILALVLLGLLCAGVSLFRTRGQDITAWGLLAVTVALLLWRLA